VDCDVGSSVEQSREESPVHAASDISGLTIRPFFPRLLDLEERWQEMAR